MNVLRKGCAKITFIADTHKISSPIQQVNAK